MVLCIELFCFISFGYCGGGNIDLLRSIDFIYGDGAVSNQIVGYVRF